ncbi:MAG TPA: LOG family protein [Thermoanaerobaculia bacterium]
MSFKSIGVFGSSRPREGEPAYEEARQIGRAIAKRRGRVVCGGYGGVMEAACRGAADEGGSSVGVVYKGSSANRWVDETVRVGDLAERLRQLRDRSEAWIFLPRGLGTMLELAWLAESVVKANVPARPLVLLGEFWRATVEKMISEASGPSRDAFVRSIRWAKTPHEAVELTFGESAKF